MTGYRKLLEKEVIEAWRTHRLVLVCALYIVLGIAVPVLIRYLPDLARTFAPPDFEVGLTDMGVPDIIDELVREMVLFGAIAAILLTMGSVAGEKERRTAGLVLSKPVGRTAFLVAKAVSIAMIFALAIALGVLAAWLYTSLLFQPIAPPLPWVQMAVLVWLLTMVYAAVTFLGSTLAGSPLGAAAIGLAGYVALTLATVIPTLSPSLPTGLADVAKATGLEEEGIDLDPGRTIAIAIAAIVVLLALAWWRFRREEA